MFSEPNLYIAPNNEVIYHNGFFSDREDLISDEKDWNSRTFEFMELDSSMDFSEIGGPYICSYDFLHGRCTEFAVMLNRLFGYEIVAWTDRRGRLLHTFCTYDEEYHGRKWYVDVRGQTTSFWPDFSAEFKEYKPYSTTWHHFDKADEFLRCFGLEDKSEPDLEYLKTHFMGYYKPIK